MTTAKKVVQAEVGPSLYEFVVRTAKAKGITLTEATGEALRRWAAMEGDLSWDPLFDPSKTFKSKKGPMRRRSMRSYTGIDNEAVPGQGPSGGATKSVPISVSPGKAVARPGGP